MNDQQILSDAIFELVGSLEREDKNAREIFLERIKNVNKYSSKISFIRGLLVREKIDPKAIKEIRKVGEKLFCKKKCEPEKDESVKGDSVKDDGCVEDPEKIPFVTFASEQINGGIPIRVYEIIYRVKNFDILQNIDFSPGELKLVKFIRTTFGFADPEKVVLKLLGYDGEIKLAMTQILHLLMQYPRKLYFNMQWIKNNCSEQMKIECAEVFNTVLVEAKKTNTVMTYIMLWRFVRIVDIKIDTMYVQYINACYNISVKSLNELERFLRNPKTAETINIEQRRFHRRLVKYLDQNEYWMDSIKLFLYTLKKILLDGNFGDAAQTGYIIELMETYGFPNPYFIPIERIAFDVVDLYSPAEERNVKLFRTDNFHHVKKSKKISPELRQAIQNMIHMFENLDDADIMAILPSILEEINDDRILRILRDGNYSAEPNDKKIEALKFVDTYEDAKMILEDLKRDRNPENDIIDIIDSPEMWQSKDILNKIIDDILSRRREILPLDRKLILDELRKLIPVKCAQQNNMVA